MSETTILTKNVIDSWHSLGLGKKYVDQSNRIVLDLKDIFANSGLKIVNDIPAKLRTRYTRITEKIKKTQCVASRTIYFGFKNLEAIFYSATEFPGLCANETPVPKR